MEGVLVKLNPGLPWQKLHLTRRRLFFTSKLDINLRKKLVKCYVWSMTVYGVETWTLRATDQKRLKNFEILCWRRMEKISWTDHVRNEEVLLTVNEQRDILHEKRKRKANWIGHILLRNRLLQYVFEGKVKGQIEVTRRWGRRRKKLLDDHKDRRGYCQLKEEALDRTIWRNRFGRGFGPVVWQITDDDDGTYDFVTVIRSGYFVFILFWVSVRFFLLRIFRVTWCPPDRLPARRRVNLVVGLPPWCL